MRGSRPWEAETKAFEDFQATAESTQQSARPDMISQQQASVLGRMILAFQNVTSQYVRLMKKAVIITGNLVQDHEFIYPYYRLLEEGLEVDVCILEGKPVVGIDPVATATCISDWPTSNIAHPTATNFV